MQRRGGDFPDQRRARAGADRASPSATSACSSSSANKNNTNRFESRRHDPSVLTTRLMQLDDCMQQVKALMKNLEKSEDPTARQHLLRLRQMLHQLSIEQASTEILMDWVGAVTNRSTGRTAVQKCCCAAGFG